MSMVQGSPGQGRDIGLVLSVEIVACVGQQDRHQEDVKVEEPRLAEVGDCAVVLAQEAGVNTEHQC